MAGAVGRAPRAALAVASLHAVILLLAATACLVRADGVEVDDKGAELPPRRFPSGPTLEKLRLHLTNATTTKPRGPPLAAAAAVNQTTTTTVVAGGGVAPPPGANTPRPFLEPTKSAAVLVAVFVCVALVGYFALLVWRRVLEKKYGHREILVNEEQFEQDRDLRNFQL